MRKEHWQQHALTVAIAAVVVGFGALARAQADEARNDKTRNFENRIHFLDGDDAPGEADGEARVQFFFVQDNDPPKESKEAPEKSEKKPDDKYRDVVREKIRGEVRERTKKDAGFWIGLRCNPIDVALRAQLAEVKDGGLLVEEVVDGSPAAKAGIQTHDVLVQAGDQTLQTVEQLLDAVKKAEGKEIKIALVRRGKLQGVVVAPTKREGSVEIELAPRVDKSDRDIILKWLDKELPDGQGKMFMRRVMPGMMMGGGLPKLPKDVTVTVTKTGAEPAKIVVKSAKGTSWELTDKDLSSLPEDLRGPVGAMVGQPGFGMRFDLETANTPQDVSRSAPPKLDVRPLPPGFAPKVRVESDGLERKLETLNERIDKLQKSLEELRDSKKEKE
jgi:membrane-associated protease RseP (regulator of RpoE activity)